MPVLVTAIIVNIFFSRGRPFYIQRRLGRGGKEFALIKLRTMRYPSPTEKWAQLTTIGDTRVTPWGRYLRRSYVDELPQLLNVILGHMSVVGPRPETMAISNEIVRKHRRFENRLKVLPGLTGLAQIYFRKPASEDDLWRKYYYDRMYISDCGFIIDLRLIIQTVARVAQMKGW